MALRWVKGTLWNAYSLSGLRNDFAKYEQEIFSGKRECPFKVTFKNKDGRVVSYRPIPLTPGGKPKIKLFS